MDKTIAFTQSSFTVKDPYIPNGVILYKLQNKIKTFFILRSFETEFVDFRSYNINYQFKELYNEVFNAYRRNDKVGLVRHCSEGMNTVSYQ